MKWWKTWKTSKSLNSSKLFIFINLSLIWNDEVSFVIHLGECASSFFPNKHFLPFWPNPYKTRSFWIVTFFSVQKIHLFDGGFGFVVTIMVMLLPWMKILRLSKNNFRILRNPVTDLNQIIGERRGFHIKEQPPQLGRVKCKCFSLESSMDAKFCRTLDLLEILHFQYEICDPFIYLAARWSLVRVSAATLIGLPTQGFETRWVSVGFVPPKSFTKSSQIEVVGVSIRPDFEKLDA